MGREEKLRTYIPVDEPDEGPSLNWFRVIVGDNVATFEVHADGVGQALLYVEKEAMNQGFQLTGQIFVRRHEPVWRPELEARFGTEFGANAVETNSADPLGSHKH